MVSNAAGTYYYYYFYFLTLLLFFYYANWQHKHTHIKYIQKCTVT